MEIERHHCHSDGLEGLKRNKGSLLKMEIERLCIIIRINSIVYRNKGSLLKMEIERYHF